MNAVDRSTCRVINLAHRHTYIGWLKIVAGNKGKVTALYITWKRKQPTKKINEQEYSGGLMAKHGFILVTIGEMVPYKTHNICIHLFAFIFLLNPLQQNNQYNMVQRFEVDL